MAGRSAAEIPAESQSNLENCIHRPLEWGSNHIETARGYGTSEMQLGRILPKLPREELILQTMVSPRATAREFVHAFETSMGYLGLEQVDLLSCTGLTTGNCYTVVTPEEWVPGSCALAYMSAR